MFFHNNNANLNVGLATEYFNTIPIKNKQFIHEKENPGYVTGSIVAIFDNYEKLKEYDFIIHMHADIFPLREDGLLNLLKEYSDKKTSILLSRSCQHESPSGGLQSDFYIFRPNELDKNFFSGENCSGSLEEILFKRITGMNINYTWIPRHTEDYRGGYIPDQIGFWHCHDISQIYSFLESKAT
ncbi:hypothetical protein EBR43_02930 [bacterium]|nr:hypothetical protein [bacterium]